MSNITIGWKGNLRWSFGHWVRFGWILAVITSLIAALAPSATAQGVAYVTVGVGSSNSGNAQLSIHAFSEYPQGGIAYLSLSGTTREIDLTCVVVEPSGGTMATYASGRDEFGQTWYLAAWDYGPTSVAVAGDPWSYGQSSGSEPCGYSSFGSQRHYGEFQTSSDPTLGAGDVYAAAKDGRPLPEGGAHVTTGSGSSSSGNAQLSMRAFSEYPQTGTAYLLLGGAISEVELSCVVVQPGGGGTYGTYASGRDDLGQTWYLASWDYGPASPAVAGDQWSFGQTAGSEPCGYSTGSQTHYGEFQTSADPTLGAGDLYAATNGQIDDVKNDVLSQPWQMEMSVTTADFDAPDDSLENCDSSTRSSCGAGLGADVVEEVGYAAQNGRTRSLECLGGADLSMVGEESPPIFGGKWGSGPLDMEISCNRNPSILYGIATASLNRGGGYEDYGEASASCIDCPHINDSQQVYCNPCEGTWRITFEAHITRTRNQRFDEFAKDPRCSRTGNRLICRMESYFEVS